MNISSAVQPKRVLVLILDSDGLQLQQIAKVVAGAIQAEVQTCNTPLGCLELARRYKPQVALVHSRDVLVENVSMVELLKAVSPLTEIRIIE